MFGETPWPSPRSRQANVFLRFPLGQNRATHMSNRGKIVECPDCAKKMFANRLMEHRLGECPGEPERCSMCGEIVENHTKHYTGGCPGPD